MGKCSLTERIEIQYYANQTQDTQGFPVGIWETYYKCWACYQPVRGREYEVAKATESIDTVTFTVRFCDKIKALETINYRVIFRNKTYNIEYIYDVQDQHSWVDIKCRCIN